MYTGILCHATALTCQQFNRIGCWVITSNTTPRFCLPFCRIYFWAPTHFVLMTCTLLAIDCRPWFRRPYHCTITQLRSPTCNPPAATPQLSLPHSPAATPQLPPPACSSPATIPPPHLQRQQAASCAVELGHGPLPNLLNAVHGHGVDLRGSSSSSGGISAGAAPTLCLPH